MKIISKFSALITSLFLLTACSAEKVATNSGDRYQRLMDSFNTSPAERRVAIRTREASAAAEAASANQTTLLVLILIVAVAILVAIIMIKRNK
jgi:CHASE3 domain sensor protein